MARQHRRLRPVLGLVAAFLISIGGVATPAPASAALPTWNGGVNLYRSGVFTTQKSWLWCTAAGVQIMRNMKFRREDHSRSNQSRYFEWMRARNRYSLPRSAGIDPQGWTAGLRHFVDSRYQLTSSSTFVGALRLAVTRIRLTNLPVALTVARGNHGWVLHGFTATADPAKTKDFRITSVRVSGPLWGLQNRSFGYDMRPNTKLFPYQLKRFFTPWWYGPKRMIWDGRFVSIQPVPTRSSGAAAAPAPVAPPAAEPSVRPPAAPSVAPSVMPPATRDTTSAASRAIGSPAQAQPPIGLLVAGLALLTAALIAVTLSAGSSRGRRTRPPPIARRPTPG